MLIPLGAWLAGWWVVGSAIAQSPAAAEELETLGISRYRAVMFAMQGYDHPDISDLRTPTEDVAQLSTLLESQYGFEVEVHTDATHEQVISTLDRLVAEVEEDDAVVLYYAGHGVIRPEEDRGYWLPSDAAPSTTARWVSTEDVAAKVRAMKARHVLVVSDSCFSGVLTRGLDTGEEVQEIPGLAAAAQLTARRSRWVIASGADEPVNDGGAEGMSVFAYALREAMRDTTDRYVTADGLFPAIRRTVAENAEQTPTQGKLAKGLQTLGQMVLVNQSAEPGDVVDPASLPGAPSARDGRPRWPRAVIATGGLVAAGGGILVATSGGWWLANADAYPRSADGSKVLAADPSARRRFRVMQILNISGGVLIAGGMATVGVGALGAAVSPDGSPTVTLRLPLPQRGHSPLPTWGEP